jgi:ABC-type Fe3+/spermidine/putrescine transport system ATPase subunit
MTQVRLTGLTGTYPGAPAPALDRLTLEVASGEMVALLGPSGCGKTTTLKLVAGLMRPVAGEITFDGRSVLDDPPESRSAVMVFQTPLLFPFLSVADNIGFGLRMRRAPKAEIAARVAEMLALVKLPDLGRRRPSDLSGGQQQRVALARALIVRPRVLLLDEPLSSLDAGLRQEMRELIRGIHETLGITTLFVTHDQDEAVAMAHRVALILNGRLSQYDRPEAFYRRPADRDVALFFGSRNLVPGRAAAGRFDSALGPLLLPAGLPEGSGWLTFRPEAVRIGGAAVNAIGTRVAETRFLGTRTRLSLLVGPVAIEAVVPPDLADGIAPGDPLTINLPPASLWVIPADG